MLPIKPGLMSYIGKGTVSVVMKEDVMSPETAKQIVPSIIVVIAHTDAGLPACAPQPGLLRDIGKRAVAIVLVKMRCRRLACRPMRVEPIAVGEVDIEPAVMVEGEEGQPASLGLNDGPLVLNAAPHVDRKSVV